MAIQLPPAGAVCCSSSVAIRPLLCRGLCPLQGVVAVVYTAVLMVRMAAVVVVVG